MCTITDDCCAQIAESDLKPPFESPNFGRCRVQLRESLESLKETFWIWRVVVEMAQKESSKVFGTKATNM